MTETMDAFRTFILLLIFIHLCTFIFSEVLSEGICPSPQYLEMGTTSTIHCLFHRNFYAVLWYNTTNYTEEDPILRYQNIIKSGAGYTSGEFDIHSNGSLVINHVSLRHEHTFRVGYVQSHNAEPIFIDVEVIVTVYPRVPFPVLENCGNVSNKCYSAVSYSFLQCSVHSSRPAVFLNLNLRSVVGDKDITNDAITIPEGVGYTSRVTTRNIFGRSTLLVLLVCKAVSPPGMLKDDESLVLVQKSNFDVGSLEARRIYVARDTIMELNCTGYQVGFLSWKKVSSPGVHELLMYAIFIETSFTEIFASDVTLGSNGSLITSDVKLRHEGEYLCFFGDGEEDGVAKYEVNVIVPPVPAYLIVDGCPIEKCCMLKAEREGNLTCKVTGIRPKVQIEWGPFADRDKAIISFTNHQRTIEDKGETFDVTLTTTYTVQQSPCDRITVECYVPSSEVFQLSTIVQLIFPEDGSLLQPTDITQSDVSKVNLVPYLVTIITLVVIVILLLILQSIATGMYVHKKVIHAGEIPKGGIKEQVNQKNLGGTSCEGISPQTKSTTL